MSGGPLTILIINAIIMVLMGMINPHVSQKNKAEIMEKQLLIDSKPNIHLDYHYNQILALFTSYFLTIVALVIFFANGDFSLLTSHLGDNLSAKIFTVIVALFVGAVVSVLSFILEIILEEVKFRILKLIYHNNAILIK